MKQLNDIETRVLELISHNADRPTSCKYIANTASKPSDNLALSFINKFTY